MKILMVCVGGFSTGLLVDKVNAYCAESGLDMSTEAHAVQNFNSLIDSFDVVLLGPQVAYKLGELKRLTTKPVAVMDGYDYAIGNAKNIVAQVLSLTK